MRSILFFSFLIAFSACNNRKELDPILNEFKSKISAKYDFLEVDKSSLGDPFRIIMIDSLAIMIDLNDSTYLNIYDVKNNNQIGNFLTRGNGPNELIYPDQLTKLDNKCFLLFCNSTQKYLSYRLIMENNIPVFKLIENVTFKRNKSKMFRTLPLPNNMFLSTGVIHEGRYAISDIEGNFIKSKYDYPTDDPNYNSSYIHKGLAYQSELGMSPDYKHYVMVFNGIIEIFNSINTDDFIRKAYSKIYYLPDYSVVSDGLMKGTPKEEDYKYGYRNVECTNDYIYTLYSGERHNESTHAFFGNEILIYNWNGKPIKRISCNIKIIDFAVDSKETFIYALVHNPSPEIIKIKL